MEPACWLGGWIMHSWYLPAQTKFWRCQFFFNRCLDTLSFFSKCLARFENKPNNLVKSCSVHIASYWNRQSLPWTHQHQLKKKTIWLLGFTWLTVNLRTTMVNLEKKNFKHVQNLKSLIWYWCYDDQPPIILPFIHQNWYCELDKSWKSVWPSPLFYVCGNLHESRPERLLWVAS